MTEAEAGEAQVIVASGHSHSRAGRGDTETRPALSPRYMACSSHSLQSGTWDGKFNHHFIAYLISNSKPYYLVKFNFVLDLDIFDTTQYLLFILINRS